MRRANLIPWCLFGVYLASMLLFVFVAKPDIEDPSRDSWLNGDFFMIKFLHWIVYMSENLVWLSNFIMLMPLAYFLSKFFPGGQRYFLAIICVEISLGIEILQGFIPGRVPDFRDVIVNGLGASVWLYFRPSPFTARNQTNEASL